jgi:hypothetical protein
MMNVLEIGTPIFDPLKLTIEIIATTFLMEPTYIMWLD